MSLNKVWDTLFIIFYVLANFPLNKTPSSPIIESEK